MCFPAAIPIATALLTVGTAYVQGENIKNAAEASAQGMEQQAAIDRLQAADASSRGDRESEAQTWRTRAIQGQQRAAIAAQGIDPGFGTPSEILGETAYFGEQEQQAIRLNAAREAWGFNANARQSENVASNTRWQGKANKNATILGGLAQGAGQLYSGGAFSSAGYQTQPTIGPVTRQTIRIPQSGPRY